MNKIFNTLKFIGCNGMDAVIFQDSLETYHLTISPSVKQKHLNTMLDTIIGKKSFRNHYIDILKESDDFNGEHTFTIENTSANNIKTVLNMIFQDYCREYGYKENDLYS
jgi:ABC-type transport system involved in Fe-S cluster assembly fused permease/ATPase subunit